MPAEKLAALETMIRDILWEEVLAHAEHLPARDKKTRYVKWIAEADLKLKDEARQRWINCHGESAWLDPLVKTLDRMLVRGVRGAAPRIAEEVASRLNDGTPIDQPKQLVADCLKHAIYDEIRTLVRRAETGAKPRTSRQPTTRKRDERMLVRQFTPQRLLSLAARPELLPHLAYCLAYDYRSGGNDRAVFAQYEQLKIGSTTLGTVLDEIEEAFRRDDETLARQTPGSTRRKPARSKGLGNKDFAAILAKYGLEYRPSSLPSLYSERSKELREAAQANP